MAYHEDNSRYQHAEQPAQIVFPEKNAAGRPRKIAFPKLSDQPRSAKMPALEATSDSGLPAAYFVRQGPAEVNGQTLRSTPIPPRAKPPVKVTVVAYQWG